VFWRCASRVLCVRLGRMNERTSSRAEGRRANGQRLSVCGVCRAPVGGAMNTIG
jgi:hypothetical protein